LHMLSINNMSGSWLATGLQLAAPSIRPTATLHPHPHPTRAGYRKMNPFCIPFAINNMGGAMLAMDLNFMGPNYSISTACATGNYCIHA